MKVVRHPDSDRHRRGPSPGKGSYARLWMLVVMLVLVLLAMHRAGQPETWKWLFGEGPQPEAPAGESAIAPSAQPGAPEATSQLPAPGEVQLGQPPPEGGMRPAPGNADALRVEFWRQTLARLEPAEHADLWAVVQRATRGGSLSPGRTATASVLLSSVARRRRAYQLQLLEELAGSNSPVLAQATVEAQAAWDDDVFPALRAVVDERPAPQPPPAALLDLPDVLQRAAFQLVRDHTPVGRPAESYAWFSVWDRVLSPSPGDRSQALTSTQLLAQPQAYRNRAVTLTGRALRVDRLRAGRNPLGLDEYFVLWIKPDSLSRVPFCVYAADVPDSLHSGGEDWQSRTLDRDVALIGRFLKVRLYDAGQPAQAPLLLAADIELPSPATSPAIAPPPLGTVVPVVLTLAGCAGLLAWFAYRTTATRRRRTRLAETQLQDLEGDPRVQTVRQRLAHWGGEPPDSG